MIKHIIFFFVSILFLSLSVFTQSTSEMDRQAQKYFENKEFSKAVSIWLNILDLDPENKEIQKKIEMLYELKQKKDLSLERAKYNYKISKRAILKNRSKKVSLAQAEKNLNRSKSQSVVAFSNFIKAYRIDPKDPEMQLIREDMERLEKIIASEEKRLRLSIAMREKARKLTLLAQKAMEDSQFKIALGHWNSILEFMPENVEAIEGKRQAKIAIDNIIRYESIKRFITSGVLLFGQKKYNESRQDFMNVLQLDPENGTAEDYIEKIDDLINEGKRLAQRRRQAENFYSSGLKNIRNNRFDDARDDLENTLSLVPNYKDARARLASIDSLRKAYEQREQARRLRLINIEFQNGMIALTEGNYKGAISAFEKTLKLDPANKLALVYIQRAKDAQRQVDEEIVDENSPYFDFVNSLIVSGNKLFSDGKYSESKKRWEQILELFPKNKLAATNLLKCEIKLNPGQRNLFAQRVVDEGRALIKKRDILGARRKFELAESIYPGYPGIRALLSQVGRKGAFVPAENYSRADKKEIDRRFNLGMSLYRRGGADNIRKALAQLKWVATRDPGNIRAVVSVNKIEAQIRSGSSGVTSPKSGLTPRQERLVRRYYYRGINYYSNNDFKRAIGEWRKVLAIDPNHTRARNNIRKCLVLLGR